MAGLINTTQLGIVARKTISPTDDFAKWVIDAASLLVRETAGHPEWTASSVPARAAMICTLLAVRSYNNPESLVSETTGPISETKIAEMARMMTLTAQETADLVALQGDGVNPGLPTGLWVQPTSGGLPMNDVLVPTTPPYSDWYIPWISADDVFAYPVDDPMPAPAPIPEP